MNYFNILLPLAIVATLVTGCEKSENSSEDIDYSSGTYVVNEGSFGANNGSISYIDPVDGMITNGIFESANQGRSAGDVIQSFAVVNNSLGYIVVNGSSKVEIVELKTFATLTDPIPVIYPRYFMPVSDEKGYLSAGSYQGQLYVIDLTNHTIVDSIKVGFGPENMVMLNEQVYVTNSGGWGVDSTISVVNTVSDVVVATLKVGKVPMDMTIDGDNNLWVYCKGYAEYNWDPYYLISETDALIQKIDPVTNHITAQVKVGKAGDYTATTPKCASSKDGESIFYLRPDGVFKINASNPELPENPIIPGGYYGLDVNPADGNIYVFESSFTGNGTLKIFDENGNKLSEGTVGIAPNGAVFH